MLGIILSVIGLAIVGLIIWDWRRQVRNKAHPVVLTSAPSNDPAPIVMNEALLAEPTETISSTELPTIIKLPQTELSDASSSFKQDIAITTISKQEAPANETLTTVKPIVKHEAANQAHPKFRPSTRNFIKNIQASKPEPEILALNIVRSDGSVLSSDDLLNAFAENFLYLGEYSIYHRYKYKNGKGPRYFSIASALNPGTLTTEVLALNNVPGLVIFMELNNPKHDRIIFKQMLATAHQLAKQLSATICDDKREPLREEMLLAYAERLQL